VARNTLSRERIVEGALRLMDAEGLAALTMPRLAESLGVGTMSLYRHVTDKDDLVDAVVEHVFRGVAVPDGAPDDWEARVVGYLRNLRAAALAHPTLSGVIASRGLTLAPIFDQLEAVHGILRAAGFADIDAARAFYALFTYVFGFVVWELPRAHLQPEAAYAASWRESLDGLDPRRYPNLLELREPLTTVASEEQFEYGLRHLVTALGPSA
jgi:AcrR family transcriptional regulator